MDQSLVLFFDGVCGLCSGVVDFVMAQDRKKRFLFSPLQGDYAKTHLPRELTENLNSLVLLRNGEILTKSDAAFAICESLGGIWKFLALLRFLPKPFRDFCYDQVARVRYQIFGKKDSCRLPTAEERSRFLL